MAPQYTPPANDKFIARDVIVDADGSEHVRFDRTYRGLPVIGGDTVVHSKGGQFQSASQTQRAALNVGTRAHLNAEDAIVAAGGEFGSDFVGSPKTSLAIYARGAGAPALAYQVNFQGSDRAGGPVDMTYIVNAQSGNVLDRWSNIETGKPTGGGSTCSGTTSATGVGQTIYSGDVAISTQQLRHQLPDEGPDPWRRLHHQHGQRHRRQRHHLLGRRQQLGHQPEFRQRLGRRRRAFRHRRHLGLLQERPWPQRHRQ